MRYLLFLLLAFPAHAQQPPSPLTSVPPAVQAAATTESMRPYTATIPGTDVRFDMVPIPAGRFKMGSPATELGRNTDEGPLHEVEIEAFWMGKTEVAWNEFELFMEPKKDKKLRETRKLDPGVAALADAVARPTDPYMDHSWGMGRDGFPAIMMTQHAANKYCQWLSARTGHFFRLPTEAEWEYAARAGTTTAYFWGDSPEPMAEYCWTAKNSDFRYQKVGVKKPNPWGLHDILGNVLEWTLDQYDPAFYQVSSAASLTHPWNKATKPYPHVLRGGSWDDVDPARLRCAARHTSTRDWKLQEVNNPGSIWYFTDALHVGFRIIRPAKVPSVSEQYAYWNSAVEND